MPIILIAVCIELCRQSANVLVRSSKPPTPDLDKLREECVFLSRSLSLSLSPSLPLGLHTRTHTCACVHTQTHTLTHTEAGLSSLHTGASFLPSCSLHPCPSHSSFLLPLSHTHSLSLPPYTRLRLRLATSVSVSTFLALSSLSGQRSPSLLLPVASHGAHAFSTFSPLSSARRTRLLLQAHAVSLT